MFELSYSVSNIEWWLYKQSSQNFCCEIFFVVDAILGLMGTDTNMYGCCLGGSNVCTTVRWPSSLGKHEAHRIKSKSPLWDHWGWTEGIDDVLSCCDREWITLRNLSLVLSVELKSQINIPTLGSHSNASDGVEEASLPPKALWED